jgi:hypothetical protein
VAAIPGAMAILTGPGTAVLASSRETDAAGPGPRPGRAAGAVLLRRVPPVIGSRRGQVILAGVAGLGLALVAALVEGTVAAGSGAAPKAAAVNAPAARRAFVAPPRPARGGDQAAMAYYRAKDPVGAGHVRDILWTGPMLRVYTDLPASDADSKTAIALCETAAAYLESGDRIPTVFVHADRNAGYPVLANKMGAGDDCRLGSVP